MTDPEQNTSNHARYARISRLASIGAEGRAKLGRARIALVGCGTLGGAFALNLARLGIGFLRLIDRDIVEEHNLATQLLFDEEDVDQVTPKATAAVKHLRLINSECALETQVTELTPTNADRLLNDVDLILDATDNFETRFLINDTALEFNIPWIYTGAIGFTGLCMPILPGQSACLRCIMDQPPETGKLPTCETVGVWVPAAQAIAAVSLSIALRILLKQRVNSVLHELDFETFSWRQIQVERRADCPACVQHDFIYLKGQAGFRATKLCGRDLVHLSPEREMALDLATLAGNLSPELKATISEDLLHLKLPEAEIYMFSDGRAFVKGVSDPARARAIYNRYISS